MRIRNPAEKCSTLCHTVLRNRNYFYLINFCDSILLRFRFRQGPKGSDTAKGHDSYGSGSATWPHTHTYLHGAEIADIHDGLVRTARRRNAVQGQQALQVDDHKPRVVAQLQQRQHHLHPDADAAGHVLPARLAHRPQDGQADGRPVLVAVAQLNKTRQAAHNQVGVDLGQGLRGRTGHDFFSKF
jgi:hypothetical protein